MFKSSKPPYFYVHNIHTLCPTMVQKLCYNYTRAHKFCGQFLCMYVGWPLLWLLAKGARKWQKHDCMFSVHQGSQGDEHQNLTISKIHILHFLCQVTHLVISLAII
jgi:hypothetical protein